MPGSGSTDARFSAVPEYCLLNCSVYLEASRSLPLCRIVGAVCEGGGVTGRAAKGAGHAGIAGPAGPSRRTRPAGP